MSAQRFMLALLVAAALAVSDARADYVDIGTLQDDAEFEMNIDASAAGTTALTITYLNRKGTGIKSMQNFTVPAGQRVSLIGKIPKNTGRMFLEVQPAGNTTVTIEVKQGEFTYGHTFQGQGRDVYDVVPAP